MKKKISNEKQRRRQGRQQRSSRNVAISRRPRLTVFRSARHIYAQLVEPGGKTITAISTRSSGMAEGASSGSVEAAKRVGKAIAEAAKQRQIDEVVFNRNGFLYHGRVKALADAAREAGLRM